jgi:hypothetical protein
MFLRLFISLEQPDRLFLQNLFIPLPHKTPAFLFRWDVGGGTVVDFNWQHGSAPFFPINKIFIISHRKYK